MNKLIRVSKEKGFTLIELMIVVGIIGILVAIAAPNFARYQSKARQSEAKIALSAVYGGLKSFYSEYSAYTPSMDAIGYAPEGDKRFYAVGWIAGTPGAVSGYGGATTTPSFGTTNTPAWTCTGATALAALVTLPTGADLQNITVGAAGSIRQGVGCDVWTITDTKILRNTTVSL
jgi:prepilin-type N-terminal cleavage/methylation domain-containing protein